MKTGMKGGENAISQHCPAETVPLRLNTTEECEKVASNRKNDTISLKMTEAQRNRLKKVAIWMMEIDLDRSDYSLTEMAKICDISHAWLRRRLKSGDVDAFKNERGHWRVKKEVVARIWQEELEKHISRLDAKKDGKKYTYRRPTEWAYHLIVKYVNETGNVTASQKKTVLAVMEKAKAQWDKDYEELQARKAANEAEAEEKEASK